MTVSLILHCVQDMTVSSYKAYKKSKFNFSAQDGADILNDAMLSGQAAQPFREGAAWPGQYSSSSQGTYPIRPPTSLEENRLTKCGTRAGTWTIPICDTGQYNWNTQFGNTGHPWPPLPCCCGMSPPLLQMMRKSRQSRSHARKKESG